LSKRRVERSASAVPASEVIAVRLVGVILYAKHFQSRI
jgi:hypothetical protein